MNRKELIRSLVKAGFKLKEVDVEKDLSRIKSYRPDQLKVKIIDIINDGEKIVKVRYTLGNISLTIEDIIEDVKINIWYEGQLIYDIPIDTVWDILNRIITEDKKVIEKVEEIKKIIQNFEKERKEEKDE